MEVQCIFENSIFRDGVSRYSCKVSSASITKQFTRIRSFKGIHEEGKTNDDVEAVQFVSTCVEFIPWRLTSVFPRLELLSITESGLKAISRKDLIGLENLISLNLGNNQLKSLPNDLFINMRKLRQISLFSNKLERMSAAVLIPIRAQLEWLSFLENPNLNVVFKSASLKVEGAEKVVSISIDEIMKLIDSVCSRPENDFTPDLSEPFADETLRGLKKIRTSGQQSDFTIAVGSKIFPAHKNILAINSSVFSKMFESQPKKPTNQIKITNFSETAVAEFLSYIYTGEAPSETHALEMYGLSAFFEVRKLKKISEDMILRNIDRENALLILEFGILQSSRDISEIAFDELKLVFPEHQLPEHHKTCLKCIKQFIAENELCVAANRRFDLFLKSLSRDVMKCEPIKQEGGDI